MIEKVDVEINTITPIYTGNAYGCMDRIEPQSMIGSLRFWFETYLMAMNLYKEDSDKKSIKLFRDTIFGYISKRNICLDDAMIQARQEQKGISLSSHLFGCTDLKGLIAIEEIQDVSSRLQKNGIKLIEIDSLKYIFLLLSFSVYYHID